MSYARAHINYLSPEPANLYKADVEAYAQKVADLVGFRPKGDLNEVIRKFGGRLHASSTWLTDESGSIYVHAKGDFDIVLPMHTGPLRDRFTICHELGHYFLHSRQGSKQIKATRFGSGRVEWEANWFAAELLMPKDAFKKQCALHGRDNLAIAAFFMVSEEAVKVRKQALELSNV